MKLISREFAYNTIDKEHSAAGTVSSGEIFQVQTQLNGGNWLQTAEDRWAPSKSKGPNLCCVIGVEGAEAGDTLAVNIIDIIPEKLGYTGFAGWRTELPGLIISEAKSWDVVTHTVAINSKEISWSPLLKLPLEPMVGTIATASSGESQSTRYAYYNGGNMDVQEICPGVTVYLPVMVKNALLHIGDIHAIMGDGEIAYGGGIECPATVTLQINLEKGYKSHGPIRAENDEYIMTVGNEIKIKDSFVAAVRELISWMCSDYGFTKQEAYLLLAQVLEARCTMLHGDDKPFSPYVCKIKKKYLCPDPNFEWHG